MGFIILGGWVIAGKLKEDTELAPTPVKGALAVNTDQSQYTPGEEVYIQIVSLDENQNTLCDSNLELSVTNPQLPISNFQLPISHSATCSSDNNATNAPDYFAYFKPDDAGIYKIILTNKDDGGSAEAEIEVTDTPAEITISRWSATCINPSISERYPMIITVSANKDFQGKISDTLPYPFTYVWYGSATLTTSGSETLTTGGSETLTTSGSKKSLNTISWDVDLKAGETTELKYNYSPGAAGNKSYSIGPISISSDKTIQETGSKWTVLTQGLNTSPNGEF